MDLKNMRTDIDKAERGVWYPVDSETKILVARYGNKAFQEELKRLTAPYKLAIQKNQLDTDTKERLSIEAIAKHILLGWEGMKTNGTPLPYSIEAAIEILSDPTLNEFRELVLEVSTDAELYRAEAVDDMVGKSQSSTAGHSNGETS